MSKKLKSESTIENAECSANTRHLNPRIDSGAHLDATHERIIRCLQEGAREVVQHLARLCSLVTTNGYETGHTAISL